MSVESFEVPKPLIDALKNMLDDFAGIGNEANRESNEALLSELSKHQEILMQFPDANNQADKIMEKLTSVRDSMKRSEVTEASRKAPGNDPEEEEKKSLELPSGGRAQKGARGRVMA